MFHMCVHPVVTSVLTGIKINFHFTPVCVCDVCVCVICVHLCTSVYVPYLWISYFNE